MEMETYLKNLFKLYKYMNDLEKLMKNPIDITKKKDYYIINKDIVSRYINSELYQKFQSYINDKINNNQEIEDISILVQDFIKKNKIEKEKEDLIDNSGIKAIFLSPETLKLKCYEYPNNFFILEEDIFGLFENSLVNKATSFIGLEGIFIEKFFKDFEGNNKLSIYFIKSMKKLNLDNFRLNKIYIYNNEIQFLNEFNTNMKGKKAESYFATRNFVNKGGIFNITSDGKKIGIYINIDRRENYENDESSEIDENRQYLEKFLK